MRTPILLTLIALSTMPSFAHTLPDAPKPTRTFLALYATDAAVRGMDAYSTTRFLESGTGRELVLPAFIADHPARLCVFEGTAVFGLWQASRFLDRHHHKRLALLIPIVDAALTGVAVAVNLSIHQRPAPHPRFTTTPVQRGKFRVGRW